MAKTKLSVTVDQEIVDQIDRVSSGQNRSEVVQKALVLWLREFRRTRLAREVESYYLGMSEGEREEDALWARLGVSNPGDHES